MRVSARLAALALAATALTFQAFSRAEAQTSKGTIRVAVSVPLAVTFIPLFSTIDAMKKAGYTVNVVNFTDPATESQALQNNQVDIVPIAAGTVFAAVDAGLQAKAFLGLAGTDFEMVAPNSLATCDSLDGKRVAIESRTGTTGTLATLWFKQTCPNAKPNIIVLAGSDNRLAGLLAGQIDATALDTQNTVLLMQKKPNDYHVFASFGDVKVLASVFYAKTAWLDANKQMVMDFTKAYNDTVNQGYANPALFVTEGKTILPDLDPALLTQVVNSWVQRKIWVPVSGVQPDTIKGAIDFYSSAAPYKNVKTAADVSTTDFVAGLK
jgi:ABC-type nitrate/sulfonate/bicarbonate transport system substrate-binding protein